MPLKFQNTSSGGGGGESLAETLVIGNTTGPEDIIQTDASVFRCNDENGLQFASTGGETHTNGGTTFATLFNTNQFDIRDLAAKALFFIRSLSSKLYLQIGDATLGNGAVFVVDDDNNRSYTDNVAHDIKVGINNAAPTVALDVVGGVNLKGVFQCLDNNDALTIQTTNDLTSNSFVGIGDMGQNYNGTRVYVNDFSGVVTIAANNGIKANNAIQAYANNAAAVAAIGTGKLYYTDVAGEYIVKLSH